MWLCLSGIKVSKALEWKWYKKRKKRKDWQYGPLMDWCRLYLFSPKSQTRLVLKESYTKILLKIPSLNNVIYKKQPNNVTANASHPAPKKDENSWPLRNAEFTMANFKSPCYYLPVSFIIEHLGEVPIPGPISSKNPLVSEFSLILKMQGWLF